MYIRYKFFTNDSFDAMQSTDLDAERESSPRSLKSRENEEQSVKLSDRLWMVKEVLTFGRKPTNLAKSYRTNRTAIIKWVYTSKKQGFLKDSKGQPPILSPEVAIKIVSKIRGQLFDLSDEKFIEIVQKAHIADVT